MAQCQQAIEGKTDSKVDSWPHSICGLTNGEICTTIFGPCIWTPATQRLLSGSTGAAALICATTARSEALQHEHIHMHTPTPRAVGNLCAVCPAVTPLVVHW